jgi:hypothetical protein
MNNFLGQALVQPGASGIVDGPSTSTTGGMESPGLATGNNTTAGTAIDLMNPYVSTPYIVKVQ